MASDAAASKPAVKKPGAKQTQEPKSGATKEFTMEPVDETVAPEAAAGGETAMFDGEGPRADPGEKTQAMDEPSAEASKRAAAAKAGGKASVIASYKLLKKLGQGGMGIVYKAQHTTLENDVALKVLSKELASKPAFVDRFKREARVMVKLDHPNILRCFDANHDQSTGYHYIAMEYVEGGSVEQWLKKLGQFELGDALHIVLAVGRALEHAHELGLIHRDIKPDNVLLTKKGIVKLADLGLAKATDDDMGLTRTGTGAGTPLYMAPEQARDVKHVDGRCDVYALGVMLYVFLTGQAPFNGTTLVEVVELKEKGKFKPIRTYNADVPERIDLIVDKMLAKDLKHRYATCTEVINDLEALGLAYDRLSFFETGDAKPAPAAAAAPSAVKATAPTTKPKPAAATSAPAAAKTSAPAPAPAPKLEDKIEPDIWYWRSKDPGGRVVLKKITRDELMGLIRSGAIDGKSQISQLKETGYRAVGAYSEFGSLFRGKIAEKKAGRGAEKYKEMLDQIEADEARKHKWKGLKKLMASFGSVVGLVVWLGVLAGCVVGGYFLVKKFMP